MQCKALQHEVIQSNQIDTKQSNATQCKAMQSKPCDAWLSWVKNEKARQSSEAKQREHETQHIEAKHSKVKQGKS